MRSPGDRKYVLLAEGTRRLYILDEYALRRDVVVFGLNGSQPGFVPVIELTSGLRLFLSPSYLALHTVDDAAIHQTLAESGVTGLREASTLLSNSHGIPIAGNLVDPTWLSVNLSGACDSHCSFCFTHSIRHTAGLSGREIRIALGEARGAGAEGVVFTGGEPTLRRELADYLREARDLGFRSIGLQTNGHRLSSEHYRRELVDAGLTSVLLSLHGPDDSIHDGVVGFPGSFSMAQASLLGLAETSVMVTVNFVVCRRNGGHASKMLGLLDRLHRRATLRYSFPIIEGAAHSNVHDVPSYIEFIEWVSAARELAVDRTLEVANVPLCISSFLGMADSYSLGQRQTLAQVGPFYRRPTLRGEIDVKLMACERCRKAVSCGGVQLAYLVSIVDSGTHVRPV